MSDLHDLVRLEDPYFYLENPFPLFRRMQQEEPVYFLEHLNTYVLTKHEDIRYVSRTPALFTSTKGVFLNDAKYDKDKETISILNEFFPDNGENLGLIDPPRHRDLRQAISPVFAGSTMGRLEGMLTGLCEEMLDEIPPGEKTDWLRFASVLPMRVAASLIGVPESDLPQIMRWADALEQVGGDLGLEELRAAGKEFSAMRGYIIEHFERKKSEPGDDLLSVLATAEVDSEKLSEDNVEMLTMLVLAAGSDTTRSMLCGMIEAFSHYPEQYDALRADRSLVPGAIEESLRWSTPARAFMRTATQDTEIRGQKIAAGQHVYMLYMAGNHDEDVFPHPEVFDVRRKENAQQLSFGFGTHVCIAAALVRIEGKILLNAMLDRFSGVELAGEPVPVIALLRNGWTEMSAVFHA